MKRWVYVAAALTLVAACTAGLLLVRGRPGTAAFDADLYVGGDESSIRALVDGADEGTLATVTVDYPLEGSLFPPEIVAPTFLWHDGDNAAREWMIEIAFEGIPHRIFALADGARAKPDIDPECVTDTNVWTEPPEQASARAWRPDAKTWTLIKRHSVEGDAVVTVRGIAGTGDTRRAVSKGSTRIRTSSDPVGAMIFYRDVPLMPVATESGVIQPIAVSALPLIKWRLRDLSRDEAPAVMEFIPTCANCHSFSRDGRVLTMDMDGPAGDKGAHLTAEIEPCMSIEKENVFSWNSFNPEGMGGSPSYGLFPHVSPDGRYVIASIFETLYVRNYADFGFLQTFYPTRGVLACYDRQTKKIALLPGADDPAYVQTNPVWSPDGKTIAFLRAPGRDIDPEAPLARFANDPNELQIRFDICTIPFNDGRGGEATPLAGASNNGMSNSFPKYSPDGRWIVFVQCANGLLMRPDSRLYILPAGGGEPRLMKCNTKLMNSWHSWSPGGRWLVFSSKCNRPYTQMFLTHVDENGNDSPPVLVPNSTADNRAVNLPEFVPLEPGALVEITTPAVEYRRLLDRAVKLTDAGRVDESMALLRESISLKDDYAPTHVELATLLATRAEYDEALAHFEKALRINPNNFFAQYNTAIILNRRGQFAEALKHCEKALRVNPDYYQVHDEWATALCGLDRREEALEHYAKVIEIDPNSIETLINLGVALLELDRVDESVARLRKAVETDGESFAARQNYGLALSRCGRFAEAQAQFRKAIGLNPQFAPAHRDLGVALLNDGKTKEGLDEIRRALAKAPDYPGAREILARVLATHPDKQWRNGNEAIGHAEIACRVTGGRSLPCLETLAAAYAEAGRFDDAQRLADQILQVLRKNNIEQLIGEAQRRLDLYTQKQPLRHTGTW